MLERAREGEKNEITERKTVGGSSNQHSQNYLIGYARGPKDFSLTPICSTASLGCAGAEHGATNQYKNRREAKKKPP